MQQEQPNNLAKGCRLKMAELDNILLRKGHALTPSEKSIFAIAFEAGVETMADQVQPILSQLELELATVK